MVAKTFSPYQVLLALRGGRLPLGSVLEQDLSSDPRVEAAVWQRAAVAHTAFWQKWGAWRHAREGTAGVLSFHDILRLLKIEEKLVAHMGLQAGDVVVDLGCGAAWMAQFLPMGIAYFGVEADRKTANSPLSSWARWGHGGNVWVYDLMGGLPSELIKELTATRQSGGRLRFLARCSLYLPMRTIVQIVEQAFAVGARDLTIDHMTAGKFRPFGLMAHFLPFLVRGQLTGKLTGGQVSRALRVLPTMIRYGVEFKKLFPLWSVAQLTAALSTSGFRVEMLEQPLFGQTTFLRVIPK